MLKLFSIFNATYGSSSNNKGPSIKDIRAEGEFFFENSDKLGLRGWGGNLDIPISIFNNS